MASSDYRSSPSQQTHQVNPTFTQYNNNDNNNRRSYARVSQDPVFPKKDQAVVLDSKEGITLIQYSEAIGNIIEPSNIIFISRISQGRVCIYLKTQQLVNKLVEETKEIKINTTCISIRPLVTKAKKVTLSNVCPVIPHSVIETKLNEYDVTPQSNILFMKAGLNDPKYSHIRSFRRQFYAKPDDLVKIPESFCVNYEGTDYWIYATSGNVTCFLCKESGHLARNCKNSDTEIQPTIIPLPENNTDTTLTLTQDTSIDTVVTNDNKTYNKRTRSEVSDEINDGQNLEKEIDTVNKNTDNQTESHAWIKPKTKKSKQNTNSKKQLAKYDMDILLQPAKEHITKGSAIYPLSYEQLKDFLEKSHGNADPLSLSKTYLEDTASIIKMMRSVYPYVDNRNIKSRFTRLINKLENNSTASDSESHGSSVRSNMSQQ